MATRLRFGGLRCYLSRVGAVYVGREKEIGSVETNKHADLFVVGGDPSRNVNDIENVELVLKGGVVFDAEKLVENVNGRYGQY